ncbi:hypothetical protein CEXT_409791 [Caerostris extrusa]|uniref:Uncharacterized protein n=1 Tax=Caerostris extrusa TaxID=172846 RepID=A0AAV4MNN0_CAEEX|nr:hypothetical protein CEXT_409791 [Caerostris extrusa]
MAINILSIRWAADYMSVSYGFEDLLWNKSGDSDGQDMVAMCTPHILLRRACQKCVPLDTTSPLPRRVCVPIVAALHHHHTPTATECSIFT